MDIDDLLSCCSESLSKSLSSESSDRAALFSPLIADAISGAVGRRLTKPTSIIFVFHCSLPEDCSKISYRDIKGDQARSDYEDMIGFHANLSCETNPESLWLLITDEKFSPNIQSRMTLESRGQIAIARLPLNPYQLMYERVVCMYAYRLGSGRDYNTSFVDGDAFIMQNLSPIWRSPYDIYLTHRRIPGLMPFNEGVFHVRAGKVGVIFSRNHLSQLEWLETLNVVRDYYGGDIRRWRGGQLALNALCGIMLKDCLPFSDKYRLYIFPCFYHNATPLPGGHPFDLSQKVIVHLKGNMKDSLSALKAYYFSICKPG
jgi:hypothetical protein